jgi:hypothetical protein
MQHIPTGQYQLHRVPTALDPNPKGPVYDGGLLVDKGDPVEEKGSVLRNLVPTPPRPQTPEELRKNTLPRKIKLLELLSSPSHVEPRYQRSWLTPTVYAMRDGNFSY